MTQRKRVKDINKQADHTPRHAVPAHDQHAWVKKDPNRGWQGRMWIGTKMGCGAAAHKNRWHLFDKTMAAEKEHVKLIFRCMQQ